MGYGELIEVSKDYPWQPRNLLLELAEYYRRRSEQEVLELAAIAADISIDDITNLGLETDSNLQLHEAFRLANPSVNPESLVEKTGSELQGYIGNTKGKYFEVLVRDRLNAGETLGELNLEPGQIAFMAESPTERDWDLEIVDQSGETAYEIELKATKTMSDVRKVLEENPNISVAVPDNLDSTPHEVLGTGISYERLTQEAEDHIEELSDSSIENVAESSAEFAFDVIPITSLLVIVAIEGRQVVMGRATLRESVRRGGRRMVRSTAYGTVGATLAAAGLGMAAIPAVMGLRVVQGRLSGQINLRDSLASRRMELEQLRPSV